MNRNIVTISIIILVIAFVVFPCLESMPIFAGTSDFRIVTASQLVSAEISLTVTNTSLDISPAIPGLTGGDGNSSTTVTVVTSNSGGYSVTVQATTSGTSTAAMKGETAGGVVADYSATTSENWASTPSGGRSQFGFGVTNTSLSSVNSAPYYGTCTSLEHCWAKVPTTTPKTVVAVSAATPAGGDKISLKFRVHVPANSNPLVIEDWYRATTTLTAIAI